MHRQGSDHLFITGTHIQVRRSTVERIPRRHILRPSTPATTVEPSRAPELYTGPASARSLHCYVLGARVLL